MCKGELRKLLATVFVIFIASILFITTAHAYEITDTDEYSIPSGADIVPSSPLYGIKLAFEELDETFTPSDSVRIIKQMENAELRISEAQAELLNNNLPASGIALKRYREKVNQTLRTALLLNDEEAGFREGLLIAERQQYAFEELISGYAENRDLLISYENSTNLRKIFEKRTESGYETTDLRTTATPISTQVIVREVDKNENKESGRTVIEVYTTRTPTPAITPEQTPATRDTATDTPSAERSSYEEAKETSTVYDRNSDYSGDTR